MHDRLLQDMSRKELCEALTLIVSGNFTIGDEEKDFDVIVDELIYRRKHHIQEAQQV